LTAFRGRQVIVYGAGKIGRRVRDALAWFGVPVEFFWDIRADIVGSELDGTPVRPPDFSALPEADRAAAVVVVTVFAENVADRIRDDLGRAGYQRVIAERLFITRLLHGECAARRAAGRFEFDLEVCHICPVVSDTRHRCDIFDGYVQTHFAHGLPAGAEPDLVVPSAGVLVSNKCTLTCVGCNHLRDHYVPANNVDIPPERILADLQKLLSAVDMVNKLVIVGGESMLHPDIGQILEGVLALPRVGVVQVITNGTVIPKDQAVFDLLASPRVMVEISGYGSHIPAKFQRNVESFLARLAARGVRHRYSRTLQWFDFGGFEHRGYSEAELKRVFDTCCFVSNDIFDGRMYKCSRSAYGTLIGKIPDYPGDYVDIRNLALPDLRARMKAFLAMDRAAVCQHCNGASNLIIEAGRQVKFVRRSSEREPATASGASGRQETS
jgi:hypothetical protein